MRMFLLPYIGIAINRKSLKLTFWHSFLEGGWRIIFHKFFLDFLVSLLQVDEMIFGRNARPRTVLGQFQKPS